MNPRKLKKKNKIIKKKKKNKKKTKKIRKKKKKKMSKKRSKKLSKKRSKKIGGSGGSAVVNNKFKLVNPIIPFKKKHDNNSIDNLTEQMFENLKNTLNGQDIYYLFHHYKLNIEPNAIYDMFFPKINEETHELLKSSIINKIDSFVEKNESYGIIIQNSIKGDLLTNITQISGCDMIIKLKNDELDKTIYLVGEIHNNKQCDQISDENEHVTIYDFYDNLFQNNICYLDFFLETPFFMIGSKSQQQNFEIKNLSDKYTDYVQNFSNDDTNFNLDVIRTLIMYKCTSKIVKCHYIDIRDDIVDDMATNFDMISENPNDVFYELGSYIEKLYYNFIPGNTFDETLVNYFKNNLLFNNIDIRNINITTMNDNTASILNNPDIHTCSNVFKNNNECKNLGNMLNQYIKHNITEEQLESINSLQELRLYIQRASRRLWYKNNTQYFKDKYMNDYREKACNRYYLNNCLPCV